MCSCEVWHSQEAHSQNQPQEHPSGTEGGRRSDWHSFMAHIGYHLSHSGGSRAIEARSERFRANFDAGFMHRRQGSSGGTPCRVPPLATPVLFTESYIEATRARKMIVAGIETTAVN